MSDDESRPSLLWGIPTSSRVEVVRPETSMHLDTGIGWTVTISPEGNGGRRSVIVSRHGVPVLSGTVSSLQERGPEPPDAERAGVSPSVHEAPAESDIAAVILAHPLSRFFSASTDGQGTVRTAIDLAHQIVEAWRKGRWT